MFLFLLSILTERVRLPRAGTVAPFAMGWLAGYIVYIILSSSVGHVAFGTFGLFFAVSFCITAFPVLARILTEKHLSTSEVCACATLRPSLRLVGQSVGK
jgi:Kef-type K+ transport system membrane component KefB